MDEPNNKMEFINERIGFDPVVIVDDLFVRLNSREREILKRRNGIGSTKHTLEKIGKDFGVTRERVRQIELGSIKKLKKLEDFECLIQATENLILEFIHKHGDITEQDFLLSGLLGESKNQESQVGATNFIISRLLDNKMKFINKHNLLRDSWTVSGLEDNEHIDRLNKLMEIIQDHGEPLEENLLFEKYHKVNEDECLKDSKVFTSHLRLSKNIDKNIFGQWGLSHWSTVKPKRMNDKIYIVLKKKETPLHFSEIAKLINEMNFDKKVAYPATVHNELILDKKYVLVGRGIYALAEWGYNHGVVADVIADILKQNDLLTRVEIVDRVLKQRIVGKSTIHLSLMNKKRFIKTDDGKYTLVSSV